MKPKYLRRQHIGPTMKSTKPYKLLGVLEMNSGVLVCIKPEDLPQTDSVQVSHDQCIMISCCRSSGCAFVARLVLLFRVVASIDRVRLFVRSKMSYSLSLSIYLSPSPSPSLCLSLARTPCPSFPLAGRRPRILGWDSLMSYFMIMCTKFLVPVVLWDGACRGIVDCN